MAKRGKTSSKKNSPIEPSIALNAICPYYTMFPLDFPISVLKRVGRKNLKVLDPFCGRGTTIFAARLEGHKAYGLDCSPIAIAIAKAKLAMTSETEVLDLAEAILEEGALQNRVPHGKFWQWAYAPDTLKDVCVLREGLSWRRSQASDVLRAICLGAMHGPLTKSVETRSYFSNQMPRTFASKPDYSVRYWRKHNLEPEEVDVLKVIRQRLERLELDTLPAKPCGMPLEVVAKDYMEAWKVLGGRATILEAAKEYARRHQTNQPKKTVPEAVDEMLAFKEKDGTSDAYLKILKVYLKQLKESFSCQLNLVTTNQLSDYFLTLDVSARSKNNARATVGAFFKFCKERGWLPRDHEGVSQVMKFKQRPTDITIYTPWEVTQFLRFSREELVPFLAIGAFAGLRSAEIERLDWTEINLKERFIEIKAAKSKTASRRLVPISDNLHAWLKPHAKSEGAVVPFENMAKQIGWLVEDTNKGLKKAAEDDKKDLAHAKQVKWKKNALRHSFISYRVAETQDVAQVALEAGNSPQIIFQHYRELVRLKEAKAWFAIDPKNVAEVTLSAKAA